MKTTKLAMLGVGLFFASCSGGSKGEIPQYKAEEAVIKLYEYRANVPDSISFAVEGVDANSLKQAEKDFGALDVYNLKTFTEEGEGSDKHYVATYDVLFKKGEGTETFKIKKVKKDIKVYDYKSDIKPLTTAVDSAVVVGDTVK